MLTKDLRNKLKLELLTLSPFVPFAWPNVTSSDKTKPRAEVSYTGVRREGGTLKGTGIKREIGTLNVVIVIPLDADGGEDLALDYGDDIDALFPEGRTIEFTGGSITITAPVQVRNGFPTSVDYRVPVAVRYDAVAT